MKRGAGRNEASALLRLAAAAGLEPRYVDGLGQRRRARAEALLAVLRGLGVGIERPAHAAAALKQLREERRSRPCEPVVVVWGGVEARLEIRAPGGMPRAGVRCILEMEGGGERAWITRRRGGAGTSNGSVAGGFPVSLPRGLPVGVHRLSMDLGRSVASATVLAAPRTCYRAARARELGVFLPLYSVRSGRGWDVGDLGDLRALAAWAGRAGCGFVGTLPLLATYLDRPFDPSPYAPVSRLFWNELYLDVEATPEFARTAAAKRLVGSAAFKDELRKLRAGKLVDYRRAYTAKRRVLDHLAAAAMADPARRRAVERFESEHPEAGAYAAFRAATERKEKGWRSWPGRMRNGGIGDGDYDESSRWTHLYAQFMLGEQLGRPGPGRLYLDLPIGVHTDGFDTWRYRGAFADGLAVGAPPDALFRGGQNWGFPPPHPWRTREDGHGYFRESLRTLMARSAALRIDHIMGLHRLFCIPHGMSGEDGVYVRQPAAELYAALAIESHRAGAEVVGENLGTVPPEVNRELERRGILKMYVAQFELRAGARACPPPAHGSLASLNTHDTPTFAAFWTGREIDQRVEQGLLAAGRARDERRGRAALRDAVLAVLRRRGLLDAEDPDAAAVARAVLRLLAKGPARKVLVNLEDLWGEPMPQNVPGVGGAPNWRRRSARTLEEILGDRALSGFIRGLASLRGGRAPARMAPSGSRVELGRGRNGEAAERPAARRSPGGPA